MAKKIVFCDVKGFLVLQKFRGGFPWGDHKFCAEGWVGKNLNTPIFYVIILRNYEYPKSAKFNEKLNNVKNLKRNVKHSCYSVDIGYSGVCRGPGFASADFLAQGRTQAPAPAGSSLRLNL